VAWTDAAVGLRRGKDGPKKIKNNNGKETPRERVGIGRVMVWRSCSCFQDKKNKLRENLIGTSLGPAAKCPLTHAKLEARPE
jgi:hypothetical protein